MNLPGTRVGFVPCESRAEVEALAALYGGTVTHEFGKDWLRLVGAELDAYERLERLGETPSVSTVALRDDGTFEELKD